MFFLSFRPENAKELFNLRHSIARNVVERIYGVDKARFDSMCSGIRLSLPVQRDAVIVASFFHNFIRSEDPSELRARFPKHQENFRPELSTPSSDEIHQPQLHELGISPAETRRAGLLRDQIAEAMWVQYCQTQRYRQRHPERVRS